MNLLDETCRAMTTVDLTFMVVVEDAVGLGRPATPGLITGLISGAPITEVRKRMERLVGLGTLERLPATHSMYRLTSLGASVLAREVADWEPSENEQMRRDVAERRAAQVRI